MDLAFNVPYGHCNRRNCKVGRRIPNTKPLNYIGGTFGYRGYKRYRGYCDDCYSIKKSGVCGNIECPIGRTIPNTKLFFHICFVCLKDYCNDCYTKIHKFKCSCCESPDCCYVDEIKKVICNRCI